jgi:uncharacterized protein YndB with AHSA1/START domain
VRVGGAWRTVMSSPEGKDHIVSGVYREITRPERLVLTWAWEEEGVRGHETLVTIELAETPGGTRLELTQEGFESERDGGLVGLADLVQDQLQRLGLELGQR